MDVRARAGLDAASEPCSLCRITRGRLRVSWRTRLPVIQRGRYKMEIWQVAVECVRVVSKQSSRGGKAERLGGKSCHSHRPRPYWAPRKPLISIVDGRCLSICGTPATEMAMLAERKICNGPIIRPPDTRWAARANSIMGVARVSSPGSWLKGDKDGFLLLKIAPILTKTYPYSNLSRKPAAWWHLYLPPHWG